MPKYETIAMLRSGRDKDLPGTEQFSGVHVPYLTEQERAPYEVSVVLMDPLTKGSKSGRLYQGQKPLMKRLDTSDGRNPGGAYMFVMDGEGRVYCGSNAKLAHHSSFLAGGPVAAAGHLTVEDGRLVKADNDSGHYMPPHEYLTQFLTEIGSRGVDLVGVTSNYVGVKKQTAAALAKTEKYKSTLERLR